MYYIKLKKTHIELRATTATRIPTANHSNSSDTEAKTN